MSEPRKEILLTVGQQIQLPDDILVAARLRPGWRVRLVVYEDGGLHLARVDDDPTGLDAHREGWRW